MDSLPENPVLEKPINWKKLILQSVLFLFIAVAVFIGIYLLARDWINEASLWLSTYLGLWGVALFVFAIDFFITPASSDIIFPLVLDWNPVSLLATMSIASILAGCAGYGVGKSLNRFAFLSKMTASYRDKGSTLIKKYGFWAVVLAALTPIPYSPICWLSGMLRLEFRWLFLGSLFRIPRMILYYLAIRGGIALFTS